MKGSIREIDGITYDISDPNEKKEYHKHYQRNYKREYIKKDPEKRRDYAREYYHKNKERMAEQNKRWCAENRTKEQKDMARLKSAIGNYIKYNYNTEYREEKKEYILKTYHIKKERRAKEGEKITVLFD